MKKTGAIFAFILFVILTPSLISAANETIDEKGYACLESKVKTKCSSLSFEEQAFSLLALAYNSNIQSECKTSLKSKSLNNECWPSSGCKIKDTALAILALKNSGEDTSKAETWLLNQNKTPNNLEWFLEIDASSAAECSISYDSYSKKINLAEDKKISGDFGSCFTSANNGYWLKISSSCLSKKFTISCNKDFLSNLLFKKKDSSIWIVPAETSSASSSGQTEHQVESYCFSTTSNCNFEDNLWASFALLKTGYEIKNSLPYLIAIADDNEKLFPSSFLYSFTNSEEYLIKMLSLQKIAGYWELSQKYYDTALGMLSLSSNEATSKAKEWLGSVQGNDGCWNNGNVRDTSILLWAGWPRASGGISDGGDIPGCTTNNFYCLSQGECDEAEGNLLRNYDCSGMKICCDKPKLEKTCRELDGRVCGEDTECDVSLLEASDTDSCCISECNAISTTTECERNSYNCRSSCLSNEEESAYDCNSGKICCIQKEGKSYWWLWLLIILIILIVIAIIFRDRIKIYIFKLKGGFKQSPVAKTRPPFYPPMQPNFRRMMPPQLIKPSSRPTSQPSPRSSSTPAKKSKTDDELEDTLKKLKEMSK